MEFSDVKYSQYLQILREELLPAMGCTEPIAMAYAAARARQTLGKMPDKIDIVISGNIIKNVKSVVVPNTGGLKGIAAARRTLSVPLYMCRSISRSFPLSDLITAARRHRLRQRKSGWKNHLNSFCLHHYLRLRQ